LAASYAKAGTRRKAQGDTAGAEAAARAALALYALLDPSGVGGDLKRQLAVARLHETLGEWGAAQQSYRTILAGDPNSAVAIRGLARVAEARGDTVEALSQWADYTAETRPGDPGWYHGQYEQARLALAGGDKRRSCDLLTKLRPAMPGLTDADLRDQLSALYKQACD
jgi:tetratricopeptide (TPR) repeat protein